MKNKVRFLISHHSKQHVIDGLRSKKKKVQALEENVGDYLEALRIGKAFLRHEEQKAYGNVGIHLKNTPEINLKVK